jgi:hypothetical protein
MPAAHLRKERRVRRTYSEIFLDKLSQLTKESEKPVSNKALRESLGHGWDDVRYERIRSELRDQNKIYVAAGSPGGLVGLVSPLGTKGLNLFICYSHADDKYKSELLKHLEPLKRLGLIEVWHDRQILAGDEWDKKISSHLEKADIVLLLVSIDFINSEYCYDIELEQALDQHESKKSRVIPVILRPCMWNYASFAKLQALPKDARAVSLSPNLDEALTSIAEGVRLVATELLASR